MPIAICCAEPEGARAGGGAAWLCCACSCAAWSAAASAAALRAASRFLRAACRAAACCATSALLWSCRRADMTSEIWTCGASVPAPSSLAELATCVAAVGGLAADWDAAVAGQKATTTPKAAAAVRTVEPVTAIVSLEGFPCRGVRRRMRDNRGPWSGARRALGFHPKPHCHTTVDPGHAAAYRT